MSASSVSTYYFGVTCTGTIVHVDFSPSACSSTESGSCTKDTNNTLSYECADSTFEASDRLESAQKKFKDSTVLLMDRFSDASCLDYTASSAYPADGQCYNFYTNGGLTANISDDGAIYQAFDQSPTCDGEPSYTEEVDSDALSKHSCTKSGNHWIRAYSATAQSTSGTSDSGSSASESSSKGESASGSSNSLGHESRSEGGSTSLDGANAGVGSGAIIGIVAGIIFFAFIGVWCARAQRKKRRTSFEITDSSSDIWKDETIVATRIPREKIVLGELLSRGAYGEVYKGYIDSQPVAIKILPQHSRRDLRLVNSFLTEAKLMASLDHPNIVHFLGAAWSSLSDLCVVSELAENGDLRCMLDNFARDGHPTGFDFTKINIALHVAHALTYLHSLQPLVLHRDLKSRNIVLTRDMSAKLTDFGVSRECSDATMTAGVGTSLWMAPEVLLGNRYNDKADIFSFGVVLSELDMHTLPYAHAKSSQSGHTLSDTAILQMVSMGSLRVQFSTSMSTMESLGLACVATDPAERPSAAEVLHILHSCLKVF